MADGFLSPEGEFFEKTEAYHGETARRILGSGYKDPEPLSELIRRGYLAMIEFRAPNGSVSLQPDLDYVLGKRSGELTEAQIKWLTEHRDELTRHQQYTINMDREGLFRNLEISEVKMFTVCETCPVRGERMAWCEGRDTDEPQDCGICDKIGRG